MRFKNLTIILTLMCLSIVALVALTLLPISEGICDWNGNESNKSYYTNSVHRDKQAHPDNPDAWSEDTRKGRGWHLSATLSASGWGSSANVSPSIYGEGDLLAFPEEETYSGTANVRAWRVNVAMSIQCNICASYYPYEPYEKNSYYSYEVDAAEDKNTDVGESQTIAAQVMSKHYVRIHGSEKIKKTGNKISVGVTGKTEVPFAELSVSSGYEWQHESGVTLSEDRRESFYKRVTGGTQNQSASISNWEAAQVTQHGLIPFGPNRMHDWMSLANSHAETNFYFEGAISSNSVSYYYDPSDDPPF